MNFFLMRDTLGKTGNHSDPSYMEPDVDSSSSHTLSDHGGWAERRTMGEHEKAGISSSDSCSDGGISRETLGLHR
jgi:hypothetical protein